MKFGSTACLTATLVAVVHFLPIVAHAESVFHDGPMPSSPQWTSATVDAGTMFLIMLVLSIAFGCLRTLPLIDQVEDWVMRD